MENIELKARSRRFSFDVKHFIRKVPIDFVNYDISKQLLRSGTSVGANIRAAFRGRSRKEFIAKLGVVIEESDECAFWLDMPSDEKGVDITELRRLEKESIELTKIFVSIRSKYG